VTASLARVLHIARREWLELRRQPVMIAVITCLFGMIAALVTAALAIVDLVARTPQMRDTLSHELPLAGLDAYVFLEDIANQVLTLGNFLLFTQFLGIAAVLAGHTVLHDRQCGTLPFLLLAPVRRAELLAGKVLGALGPPLGLFLVWSAGTGLILGLFPITENLGEALPPSPAWLVAWALGTPAWATFICTLCAIVSSLSRDVRTAQQAVWFVMFFSTLLCGVLLAGMLAQGVVFELIVAAVGAVCAVAALLVGATVIRREVIG